MKRTKKKNPLNKRVPRELKQDIGKYLALLLFLTLTIGFVSGFLVAGGSMKGAYDDSFEKYTVEDGHFTLATELPEPLQEELEAKDVRIYPLWYKDFELSDTSSVRIYKSRTAVDRICLMEGSMPEADDEIVIDRLYAENNEIAIGDEMHLDDKLFTVSGVVAFSDYSALFKNNTDMMFNASTFTVACVTDAAFNRLTDAHIKYTYAWVNDDRRLSDAAASDKGDELKDILAKSGLLTDFVKAGNNQAIIFTGDDIGGDQVMVITMLYIVMAILAFIFGVTTRNTIEREAGTIGTLRASGYSLGELVRHYMILPSLVTLFSAVIGNVLGYTLFKGMVVDMYYHSYSLPIYETLWNSRAFVLTTVIPCIIVMVVILLVLCATMKLPPLQFLRHELSVRKAKKVMPLRHFSFMTRFRLRVIRQNLTAYLTLFLGVLMASFLLFFGLMLSPLLDHFKGEVLDSEIAAYQYILKVPVETSADDAEKYAVLSLENPNGEEITVYGISENSGYFSASIPEGEVLLSDGYMEKYGVRQGDSVTLTKKYTEDSYDFTVDASYHYPATLALFMNIDDFRKMFDKDENYFSGYFSDQKLNDIDDSLVSTIITERDLTTVADQLSDSMSKSFWMLMFFAVILYLVVIYLLSKQVIEKNVQAISMTKILGYSNGEITRLYNVTTGIVMLVSLLVSLPLSNRFIRCVYYLMMQKFNGWLTYYVAPWIYPAMVAIGAACYAVVYLVQTRRIRKIPLGEALKNME